MDQPGLSFETSALPFSHMAEIHHYLRVGVGEEMQCATVILGLVSHQINH